MRHASQDLINDSTAHTAEGIIAESNVFKTLVILRMGNEINFSLGRQLMIDQVESWANFQDCCCLEGVQETFELSDWLHF